MSAPKFPPLRKDVAFALKAFGDGVANEGQQKTALDFILFEACGIRNPSFAPGDPHLTDFNEGRRFAGLIIAGAMQATPATPVAKTKTRQEAKPNE